MHFSASTRHTFFLRMATYPLLFGLFFGQDVAFPLVQCSILTPKEDPGLQESVPVQRPWALLNPNSPGGFLLGKGISDGPFAMDRPKRGFYDKRDFVDALHQQQAESNLAFLPPEEAYKRDSLLADWKDFWSRNNPMFSDFALPLRSP